MYGSDGWPFIPADNSTIDGNEMATIIPVPIKKSILNK